MDILDKLFLSYAGIVPQEKLSLTPSGSNRKYYRLSAGEIQAVAVKGTDRDENNAFICLSRHFRALGLNVPTVLAVSEDGMAYLQDDLGDTILYDVVASSRKAGAYSEEHAELLCKAMAALPDVQFKGAEGLDFSVCYPDSAFNARMVDFDLNYFKYCFLKPSGVEFNEVRLQDDFDRLKADLMAIESNSFMYRDFQARNVMLKDGEPWFIDFQGGRRGPFYYDVASFVWQAKARYPHELKQRLIKAYRESLRRYHEVDDGQFNANLRLFVLFRTLQVLGAYGFRGKIEKKAHFLESIPPAIENLRELIEQPFESYPYLTQVLAELVEHEKAPVQANDGLLEVHVMSFSFKKGLPEDRSGNGGGYVFDCRSVHNPGKYERYKRLTGLDADVQQFLEDDGEIFKFLDSVFALVDAHVARFVERGFSHLQVAFGCTGGQHRSAYSALRTAEHLSGLPGVRVHLTHRELGIDIPDFKK